MLPGLAPMIHSAGAGGGLVLINDATAYKYTTGAAALASYSLGTDGKIRINGAVFDTWLKSGLSSDYDARATIISGAVSSGTTGSWLNLATTATWSRNQVVNGDNAVVLKIEISLAGAATAIDDATITIEAERDIDTGTL